MLLTYYVLMSMVLAKLACGQSHANKRQKRYLIFTSSTQWGVFATISVPLHPEATVSLAWFFEANYYNVDNSTYFNPLLGDIGDITLSRSRDERSAGDTLTFITRRRLYTFLESMFNKHSYPARACLLRAICENVTSHFLENGLLGDLLHLVFTPSTSMQEDDIEDCYYEAEFLGLENECDQYRLDCPSSPLELISTYIEHVLPE